MHTNLLLNNNPEAIIFEMKFPPNRFPSIPEKIKFTIL